MKKLSLILTIILLLPLFISCSHGGESGAQTEAFSDSVGSSSYDSDSPVLPESSVITTDSSPATGSEPDKTSPEESSASLTDSESNAGTDPAEGVSTPLFWRVSGNGFDGNFYLLGSMHAGLDTMNNYHPALVEAYKSCDCLAVEADILAIENDLQLAQTFLSYYVYTDGSTITDHITEEQYNSAVEILSDSGYYSMFLDYYSPIMWSQFVEQCYIMASEYDFENGCDRFFLKAAKDDGKEILELEDYMKREETIASFGNDTGAVLLKSTLSYTAEEYAEELGELYYMWIRGDYDETFEMMTEEATEEDLAEYTEEEIKLMESYEKYLHVERNRVMSEGAISFLEADKDVFLVAGLAHMFGEDNIVESLREAGYTVELCEYK